MNFIEVVKLLQLDKNVKLMRRDKDFKICADVHGITKILTKEGYRYFTLSNDDILAEDWYVVKDEKLHTFEEAIVAFKAGKKIKRPGKRWIYIDKVSFKGIRVIEEFSSSGVVGSSVDFEFTLEDILAYDWIIIDKEETK